MADEHGRRVTLGARGVSGALTQMSGLTDGSGHALIDHTEGRPCPSIDAASAGASTLV